MPCKHTCSTAHHSTAPPQQHPSLPSPPHKHTQTRAQDEEAGNERKEEKFVPFGSILTSSGTSVRATVGCSAGLAKELPLWGVHLKGDSAWMVRAFKAVDVVVLREGERSLIQATLIDADGKGIPTMERLKDAVLLAVSHR